MFIRRWGTALVVICVAVHSVKTVAASEDLRGAMSALAKAVLANTKNQPVTVGQFSPTALALSNSGPGLEQLLREELEIELKDSVQANALFEVKGDYQLVIPNPPEKESNKALREIKLTARLIDKNTGEERKELRVEARFNSTKDIAKLAQITANLRPDGTQEERNKELQRRNKEPSVFIGGPDKTLISSSEKSLYAVELLVKPLKDHEKQEAKPREAKNDRGQAFVDIPKDNLYEVKIYNRSQREVAISLTIDGIDVFHFSKDRNDKDKRKPRFTHFIVAPNATETIVGWHNTIDSTAKDNFLSFLVTAYGQGAVSKAGIKSRGQVGVIHVQFSECKPLEKGAKAVQGNKTVIGPPREVKQTPVRYEIEPPHDFVSVRYTR